MMNTKPKIDLRYSVNALCAAERSLGKRTVDIIEEMESDGGPAVQTLRAMLAAGLLWKDPMAKFAMNNPQAFGAPHLPLGEAGLLIDQLGVNAVSADVGIALGAFLRELGGEEA